MDSRSDDKLTDDKTRKMDGSPKLLPMVAMEWLTALASPSTIADDNKHSDGHDVDKTTRAHKNVPKPHCLDTERPHATSPNVK